MEQEKLPKKIDIEISMKVIDDGKPDEDEIRSKKRTEKMANWTLVMVFSLIMGTVSLVYMWKVLLLLSFIMFVASLWVIVSGVTDELYEERSSTPWWYGAL